MDRDQLRQAVEAGFVWAKESGFEIVKRQYRDYRDKCGCALQCAYWAAGGEADRPGTEEILDQWRITRTEAWSFLNGFDGIAFSPENDDLEFYMLGKEFGDRV